MSKCRLKVRVRVEIWEIFIIADIVPLTVTVAGRHMYKSRYCTFNCNLCR